MSFAADQIYYADQGLGNNENAQDQNFLSNSNAELKFQHFIQEQNENNVFIYR